MVGDEVYKVHYTHHFDYHYAVDRNWRNLAVTAAQEHLSPIQDRFDSIAVRGMSGATVGAILAHILGKDLIIVRKPDTGPGGEASHAHSRVEGIRMEGEVRYLIVDDFSCSGETLDTIQEEIAKDAAGQRITCIGHYLYRDEELTIFPTPAEQADAAASSKKTEGYRLAGSYEWTPLFPPVFTPITWTPANLENH